MALSHLALAAAAAFGIVFMSSCSSTPNAASTPALDGTDWVLAELAGRPALAGERPTAHFASGRVHGTDGCNRYSMAFTADGPDIHIGPMGPSTMMACPPEVMEQAQAFIAAMSAAQRYEVVDSRLRLLGTDRAVLATLAAQSQALAGTSWEATAINNGRQAVVGLIDGTSATMTFGADGRVSGSAGCNQYSASYQQDQRSLQFGPAAASRRMCVGEGVMEQEQAFLRALESVHTMRIDGDRLEMRTADDALALMLRRSAP